MLKELTNYWQFQNREMNAYINARKKLEKNKNKKVLDTDEFL